MLIGMKIHQVSKIKKITTFFNNTDLMGDFRCDNDSKFGLVKRRKANTYQNKKNLYILVYGMVENAIKDK
jgi:hypothetical protein